MKTIIKLYLALIALLSIGLVLGLAACSDGDDSSSGGGSGSGLNGEGDASLGGENDEEDMNCTVSGNNLYDDEPSPMTKVGSSN